jgi:hypothetical protein
LSAICQLLEWEPIQDRAVCLARPWNAKLLIVHEAEESRNNADQPSWLSGVDPIEAAHRKLLFDYPGWEGVDMAIEVRGGKPEAVVIEAATLPEFLWEFGLGLWLLVKGFNSGALAALDESRT